MSLFTVEQTELIRRLRLTGISAQQIIEAFNVLDRLDYELAPYEGHNTPTSFPAVGSTTTNGSIFTPSLFANAPVNTISSPYETALNRFPTENGAPKQTSIGRSRRKRSFANATFPQSTDRAAGLGPKSEESRGNNWSGAGEHHPRQETGIADEAIPQWGSSVNSEMYHRLLLANNSKRGRGRGRGRPRRSTGGSYRVLRKPARGFDYSTIVSEEALEEFVSGGEMAAIDQIKEFIVSHQLRQQKVADMTGVSQPYISRFLNGSYRDLSARVRRIIYRWFLAVQENPELLSMTPETITDEAEPPTMVPAKQSRSSFSFSEDQLEHEDYNESTTPGFTTPDPDALPVQTDGSSNKGNSTRRDRFIFKPFHTRMLQKYFTLDSYPNIKKRQEIAAACNKGCGPTEPGKEVTSQIVANWFANRRKEQRRRGELKLRRFRRTRARIPKSFIVANRTEAAKDESAQASTKEANKSVANVGQVDNKTPCNGVQRARCYSNAAAAAFHQSVGNTSACTSTASTVSNPEV